MQSSERLLIAMLRAAAEAGAALANHAEVTGLLLERGRVRGARACATSSAAATSSCAPT